MMIWWCEKDGCLVVVFSDCRNIKSATRGDKSKKGHVGKKSFPCLFRLYKLSKVQSEVTSQKLYTCTENQMLVLISSDGTNCQKCNLRRQVMMFWCMFLLSQRQRETCDLMRQFLSTIGQLSIFVMCLSPQIATCVHGTERVWSEETSVEITVKVVSSDWTLEKN